MFFTFCPVLWQLNLVHSIQRPFCKSHFNIILAFSLRPALPRELLFERGLTVTFMAFSFPALCSTRPIHLILLYLMAVNNNLLGE